MHDAIRLKHYFYRTEQSYVQWNACGRTMSRLQMETPNEITLSRGLVARAATTQKYKSTKVPQVAASLPLALAVMALLATQ